MAVLIRLSLFSCFSRRGLLAAALLVASGGLLPAWGKEIVPAKEYQIKAAFLFNFAQFVDWPPAAFADAQAPLIIGILGDDPYGNYLTEIVRGEKVNNRPLIIRHYRNPEEITACHVLFISRSEYSHLEPILARLKDRSILTVGDAEGFTKRGGMIRFVIEDFKVRFRINIVAVRAAELIISSKMLRPAEIITPGKD